MTRLGAFWFGVVFLFMASPAGAQVAENVCIIGDSQSRGVAGAAPMWWQYVQADRPGLKYSVSPWGIGGLRCDQLEVQSFQPNVLSAAGKTYGCTRLVIQCGVNDLMQSYTANQICGAVGVAGPAGTLGTSTTPGPVRRMAAQALAAGIQVTIINVAPWGAHSAWTAAKQAQTEATNACFATIPGVVVVDAYTALGMPGSPTLLNTAWDDVSGGPDGLHWDTEGARALATAANNTPGAVFTAWDVTRLYLDGALASSARKAP